MLRIKTFMKERGDQARLAEATGIYESHVSRLLNGGERPYRKWGEAIAAAVGWPGDWEELFEEVDEEVTCK